MESVDDEWLGLYPFLSYTGTRRVPWTMIRCVGYLFRDCKPQRCVARYVQEEGIDALGRG